MPNNTGLAAIWIISNSNHGTNTDRETQGRNTTMANETRRVAGVNPLAIKQASMLDELTFDHFDTVHTANLIKRTSAAIVRDDILRCFAPVTKGKGNDWSIIDAWPLADSGRTEDGEIDYSCNNPDYTKTINGKRTVWVSYFDTIVLRSPRAMALQSQKENISDTLKNTKNVTIGVKLEYEGDGKTLDTQLSSYKATFKNAVRLVQAERRAAEFYPELKIAFHRDTDGDVKQKAEPMMIFPQELPLVGINLTVSQFCKLDFELVHTSGETEPQKKWDILMSSLTREPPEKEDEDNIEITNSVRFETGAASMLDWLRSDKNVSSLYNKIDGKKNIGDVADYLLTIDGLATELDDIRTHFSRKIDLARDYINEREKEEEAADTAVKVA